MEYIEKGDVVSIRLSGAGGYGNAEERDPHAIQDDLLDGYISAADEFGHVPDVMVAKSAKIKLP